MRWLLPVCLTLAATPVLAGATPWQEIAPGVKARLISADTVNAGTSLAGLELDMPSTTNIYWRMPGETGIPTVFDFAGSSGLGEPSVAWPIPEIDRSKGYLDYVYRGPTVLPIALMPDSAKAMLVVRVTLGVCSDMCAPAAASFALPIAFDKPDPGQSIRLDQAEANVPIPWDRPGNPVGGVMATPEGLALAAPDPSIDPASLIVEVGDPSILFETPQKSPDGALWNLRSLGGVGAGELEGRAIQLTFNTPAGPYTVSRQVAAGR
ncbi:MAG TPA: hypothetical protein VHA07_06945 [Devosia sp.]|nr:hypothetical protein [Devosia sp.]